MTLSDDLCDALDALGWTPLRLHQRNGVVFVWSRTPTGTRLGVGASATSAVIALLRRNASGDA